jgi:hypothetical protein
LLAKLVPAFAERQCHVVSVTDLYGRILSFLDRHWYPSKWQNGLGSRIVTLQLAMLPVPSQICMAEEWTVVRDDARGFLYAYYDDNWVSYDDVSTVRAKVR